MHEGLSTPDRYEVVRRIGAGGMGVVYEAEDRERGQRVALKTIPNPGVEQVYQLKREFRVLADLSHPNLVVLYDLVVDREACFFTMELVDGEDLLAYLWNRAPDAGELANARTTAGIANAKTGAPDLAAGSGPGVVVSPIGPTEDSAAGPSPCDLERLRAVLPQLARGLHALHAAGKIHRDVKPSNVRVTPDGRVVLLDFGLVAEIDRRRAGYDDGAVVGTVGYMAPEQAAGDVALTPAVDWYALGVVMFHAMTGRLPFDGPPARVLLDKQAKDAPSASRLARGLPADLVELCAELLERDAANRPGGAALLRRLGIADTDPSLTPMISVSRESSFAGREKEIEQLMGALEPLDRGRPSAIVVRGRSGMGKTTLVSRFLEKLVARDALVLRGRCFEREDIPYKAMDSLVDELSDWWLDLTPKEAQAILPRDARLLPTLFPMLGRVPAIADSPRTRLLADPQALRSHAFDALREALQRLADRHRVVLFLDDMQWVDRDTTTLLADLMRAPDPPALLLVLSTRADEDAAVLDLVRRMDAEPTIVDVGPLADADATRLAAAQLGDVGDDTLRSLVREAGGNPFFLIELTRYLHGKASLADVAGQGLEAMLSSRLDALGDDARLIADLVAVAGEPIQRRLISAASSLAAPELSRQLTHLRGQRVVRTAGARADDTIEPYHDRVRESLLGILPADRRAKLHRALATALAAQGTAEQLARHWHGAGDKARAAGHARRAADEARAKLDFDRAAGWYALALDGDEWTPAERRTLVAQHAEALADAGRPREAASEYLRAADGSDAPTALELRRRAADQLLQSGHIADGLDLTRAVLAEVGMTMPRTPRGRLWSMLWRRAWLRLRGVGYRPRPLTEITQAELTRVDVCEGVAFGLSLVDTYGALDFAARFLSAALALGEKWRVSRAIALETDFIAAVGNKRRALQMLDRLDKLTAEIGGPAAEAQLHSTQGFVEFFVHNQWRRALDRLNEAIAVYRPLVGRAGFELDTVSVFACWARYYSGEIAELSRVVPAMAEAAARGGNLYTGVTLRCAFPVAWLARLDPAAIEANLDEAVAAWSIPGNPFQLQHLVALCSRVDLALYRGDPEAATPHIERAWRPMRRSLVDRPAINMLLIRTTLGRHAIACAAAAPVGSARRRQAIADARRHARVVRGSNKPLVRASAGLIDGTIHEIEGRPEAAVAVFRSTLAVFEAHTAELFAHPLRDRIGRIIGGDEGAALRATTAAWLAAQQVREPATMLAMLLPEASPAMTTTRALTVVAEIVDDADVKAALRDRVEQIGKAIGTNPVIPFDRLPDTHFTRWLILGDPHPEPHPDVLVWESNHDGDTLDYLEAVTAAIPGGLDALFGCCVGYPRAGAAAAPDEVAVWLKAHTVRAQAFYCAYRGHPRRRVVADATARTRLGEILDAERAALVDQPVPRVHARLRAQLAATEPALDSSDDGDGVIGVFVRRVLAVLALAVVGLALLPVWVALYLLVRRAELRDRDAIRIDRPVHDEGGHHQLEDHVMQNQLTHVVDIKPGVLRLVTVWVVLTVVDVLARYFYVNGSLQGMTTIHFARWAIFYDTRTAPKQRRHRLVFFSNYDGSWDAYLGEFIDRGSPGLTAIWSNTEGFPETWWLFGKGSRDEEAFKQWARRRQRPNPPVEAQAWWSGIPSSTVANVRDARWVRRRLDRTLDDEEVTAWLRRL